MAPTLPSARPTLTSVDPVWDRIREEAAQAIADEP